MKKNILDKREKVKNIKVLRPTRLSCRAHKFHMKKLKGIKAKKSK